MAMARVTITCSRCGKEFEIKKKCWNRNDANSFVEWAENNIDLCRDCERELEYQQAAEETKDLPNLDGTEKQVRWATVIRAKFGKMYPDFDKFLIDYKFICNHQVKAAWWIDNQSDIVTAFGKVLRENNVIADEYKTYIASIDGTDSN